MKYDIVPDEIFTRMNGMLQQGHQQLGCYAYEYTDEAGKTIGCVGRLEYLDENENRKKTFIQADFSWKNKKFLLKADVVKTSLYNRHAIKNAENVVWVEGEKVADTLQAILPDGWCATTNAGGAGNAVNINYSPLLNKNVVIWRDNDNTGLRGAMKLNTLLATRGVNVAGWVKIEDTWGDKWDAVDVIEKFGVQYTIEKLKNLGKPEKKDIELPALMPTERKPFIVLGRSTEDDIYVYCCQDATIRNFSSKNFDQGMMVKIYNDLAYWRDFCGMTPRSMKPDQEAGWQKMWTEVVKYGIFEPEATRYGGIYKDGDEYVANLGDRLYVDGKIIDLADRMEHGIYVEDKRSDVDTDEEELSQPEAKALLEYFEFIRTRYIEQRQLMVGWCVASLLAPILPKRPHLWLFAPANTGKSFISGKMQDLVGSFSVSLDSSSTTFAGLKQFVQGRGCAVFWDESEAQDHDQKNKWNRVMEVVRISFDSRDGKVVQGSREQVAKFFVPRMMFCFSSVKMADFEETLSTRIIPVQLMKPNDKKDMLDYYKEAKKKETGIDWDTIPSKLFKLVYNNIDVYFDHYEKAYDIFTDQGVDARRSSALAVCFAGFFLLRTRKIVSKEVIEAVLWKNPYKLMPEQESEAQHLKSLLFSATITNRDGFNKPVSIKFIDYCSHAVKGGDQLYGVDMRTIKHEFELCGLYFSPKSRTVFVWDRSPRLYRVMGNYSGMASVAPSLEGYKKTRNNSGLEGFSFDISQDLLYDL